jgi:hypothetical protein
MSLPPSFDNLLMSLYPCPPKLFIVTHCFTRFPKKKSESTKNVTLFTKTHKANEKLCFNYKKPHHFLKNCLKKKSDDKEEVNQACEDQEQMFVPP